jgi:NADPH:quinone reductase-like Zn-dependent oxidoreductase
MAATRPHTDHAGGFFGRSQDFTPQQEALMKAVVMTAVGGPEVLQVKDVPLPRAGEPGAGEVLVRVKAAAVNPIDYKLRQTGAAGMGPGKILGVDVAGVVEKIGPGVTNLKPGERVFYAPEMTQQGGPGGYAQFNLARAAIVWKIPENLDFVQAAAMPLAGLTAWESLINRGRLHAGETIFIAAANGGVGSVAVQIAKAAGACVYATCSTRSMDFVKEIPTVAGNGPDRVFDYTQGDWSKEMHAALDQDAAAGGGVDLVFDAAGKDVVLRASPLLKRGAEEVGRVVTIVNPEGKLADLYRTNTELHYVSLIHKRPSMEGLRALLARGAVVPLVERVMKLEEAGEAHKKLEAGGARGKTVLVVE